MVVTKSVEIGGKLFTIETGRFAKQAGGAVMVTYGETMVLVTAVASEQAKEEQDFFPLQVEYREKTSAAGKFPGGFIKREGRPTEKEILTSRLIDRPIRPLFPAEFLNETQVVATVYSFDTENDADMLAACGASAALSISDIPFSGPIAEVRVGAVHGELIVNPTRQQIAESDLELVVAGTSDSIMMVEGEANEVSEDVMLKAIQFAHNEIKKLVQLQKDFTAACGKTKRVVEKKETSQELFDEVSALANEKLQKIVASILTKEERSAKNKELNELVLTSLEEKFPEQKKNMKTILHDLEKNLVRKRILSEGLRLDGRNTTQVRPITVELGVLPRTHGSALFTRGETQSLTTVTLGTKNDEQIIDGLNEESTKRFLLHYNFPPFCVGEVGRMTGVGRREIGHGNLAERSLKIMAPNESEFPYTVRIISDILESNGSSSMATVCAGSLAMMDGGVPLKKAIAGIAMGLVKEENQFAVLTDILGNEDHLGDMDFKVAGTIDGITGFQMDIKIEGISFEILEKALNQAKAGRLHILGIMNEAISKPRESLSKYAPHLISIKVETDQIGMIIGPGGKTIQGMQRLFGVDININDDGVVNIASPNAEGAKKCKEYIKQMTATPEVGEIYDGVITKIMDFGAFVEILPGKEGLLHISQIDNKRVNKVTDYFKEGDKVRVKLLKVENGKFSLSRKELLNEAGEEITK
ncbi:MAG: polyribonucleotide nucleotidyltransferase [Ignavibacteria bacterium CG22_combo_CG10-13_8_21_14_all_37_15]|nr:polyribonucleotide nucleotidyltransferase [Ignavibacteria bacterium]PIP77107.1 MAG: polyribonucleotide nucleotidyltransferase [Ignavibacteria bacterium CG22_combo_CG10-13_8_21_14_all_37_15]PIS44144.1 MAG: polyribonucleotide nucleotidyltransferase [Ignavibacteria bacterium CG08_land_8_20_14_0_20_37_9]PIX95413.1 MAG: polyribonucleotide nucleotidyltransferase [Ignavibacteria bacterium CG_4_10_14_3_um_filter_37_18]PJC58199.1 MAG: polyribonucleotide nucleotidyltransferase [Ignavibacteria bacteriu